MNKIWLIAKTTYRRRVRSGMFLILTLGLPILMVIAGAIPVLQETRSGQEAVNIGYVDQTGQMASISTISVEKTTLHLTSFRSQNEAQSAFQAGRITGFLVIPEDYFQGGSTTFYAEAEPSATIVTDLQQFMRKGMLPNQPDWVLERLSNPSEVTYVEQSTGVEIKDGPVFLIRILVPVGLGFLFALAVFTGASQMGSVVVREKEQRALEMVITSLAPRELIAGKVLGMTMLSLTQIGIWTVGGIVALLLALSSSLDLGRLSIPWNAVFWALILGVPCYYLYAVTASGLGIIAGDQQQAQQLAGILSFVGLTPLWFLGIVVQAPDGPLAVILTIFPFTAPMIGLIRMSLTNVPIWQLATGFGLIIAMLLASTWLVARVFRAAMLLYGKSLRPKELIQALRNA
jgi:ABC-2 type transport system permease protein